MVAIVDDGRPVLGICAGQPRQGIVVEGLLDLLEAPDTDLEGVGSGWDTCC